MFRTTDNIAELREQIDIQRLQHYLESAAPSIKLPIKLQQFLHGQSNPTLLITDSEGARYVLRKKPQGELLSQTAHAIEREFRVMNALEKTTIAVPKMYCLCEDKGVIGTPFYVSILITDCLESMLTAPRSCNSWTGVFSRIRR